jgi:diguanylate cyclase (GGDEF)-like protein
MAVLVLDLDDFKRINDTLGHRLGDRLLREVAHKLAECVRDSDSVARSASGGSSKDVSRLGGDEFTVLLTELEKADDAARVAGRILAALSQPIALDGHDVFITPSIGIAVFPDDGRDGDQLLKNADTAMYHAKSAGKNTFRFYTESMGASALERLELERRLRSALERGELRVHYQPQVDARSRQVVGMEALARWQSPELGPVSPAVFIPLAEKIGMIDTIGEWVLRTACSQNQAWQEAGMRPLRVAVNLSGLQFRQPGLVRAIARILADTRLEPRHLELEVTESTIMRNATDTISALNKLKGMGLRLAVDDFGTGYSSLSYLSRFPLDVLKVDRSFVQAIPGDHEDAAIASAIIALSQQLKLKVIAEGVESEEQLAFLSERGCDEVQGFLFSPALPADEFEQLVRGCNGNGLAAGRAFSQSSAAPRPV